MPDAMLGALQILFSLILTTACGVNIIISNLQKKNEGSKRLPNSHKVT